MSTTSVRVSLLLWLRLTVSKCMIWPEVPAEVLEKAIEYNADFVGSSALLTTTMTEQKNEEPL